MKVYEGAVLTVDSNDSVAKFLVEDGGKIVFVGNELPEKYKNAEKVNLGSGCLVPAFVDTHQHFASFAVFNSGLNVMNAESNAEILEMSREYIKKNPDVKTVIAFGASPYSVSDGVLVSREQLDSVCPDKPMFVAKYDGHAAIVNTVLLNKLNDKLKVLRGYHPDTGEMNQEAFFVVSSYVTNSINIPELVSSMQKAVDYEAANGVGMIHTVSGIGFPLDMDISLEKWFGRSLENGFQLRVFSQTMDTKLAIKRGFPRIGGCFACALDGCFGSDDAAMNEDYEGAEGNGVLYYSDEKVTSFMKEANRAGLQIEVHAIGDRAFDQATRCLKAALDDYPRKDHRHTIIHDCLPTDKGVAICKEYNILMAMQTAFIGWKQEPDEYLEMLMGKERASRLNPMRDLWDNGIFIAAGSDAPCTDPAPLEWIDHAVNNRSCPKQALTVKEALRMCTYNGCYITFDENERGSLEVGKVADMVILSDDLYEIPTEKLGHVKVVKTVLGGKDYTKLSKSFLGTIVSGMLGKGKI